MARSITVTVRVREGEIPVITQHMYRDLKRIAY
jgi:hypothetical protein